MRLEVPITGTVLIEGGVWGDGNLTGADDDPIQLININLGPVSWTMVDVDLDREVMIIEVEPNEDTDPQERPKILQDCQALILGHTKDELYAMTGEPRLKRPFKPERPT